MRHALARVAALLGTAALVGLGAGFLWFVHDAGRVRAIPPDADGIVVLTGGALRVETGLALLHAGVAPSLLISGVGNDATAGAVIAAADDGAPDDLVASRRPILFRAPTPPSITLGRGARTTVGNAVETASWARQRALRSIVVVTAGYHMRRALAEIAAQLPDVSLRPYPVHPKAPFRLLALEYLKFLAVEFGASPTASAAAST